MNLAQRIFAGLMSALFVLSAGLQLNDPDPFLWVFVYLVAAGLCVAATVNRPPPRAYYLGLAGVCFAWALFYVWVLGFGEPRLMFPDGETTGSIFVDTEEGRELGGLMIVFVTMLIPLKRRDSSTLEST